MSFTKVQNAVVFNVTLSLGARVAHTALLHLSWKAGRRNQDDVVSMPALHELATLVGCSRTAFTGYLKELKEERLVFTKRVRNQGMLYMVLEQPAEGEELVRIPDELKRRAGTDSGRSRARAILPLPKTASSTSVELARGCAPDAVMVGGQNLPFNALRDVCGINTRGNRSIDIATALSSKGSTTGIRDLFWIEVNDWALKNNLVGQLEVLIEDPEWFERALARRIERKAALYQKHVPGALMTPFALRKWWLDVETQSTTRRDGGMTGDEIRNFNEEV